ncbi:MAG TPA: hypothetical protein VIU34_09100 [Steroidobacter sp.]
MTATLTRSLWSQLVGLERAAVIGRPDDGRLAHEFAALLQREFVSSGRQSGEVIGTLSDIRQRYGLGRWACREAVGILEMRGLLESRRGAGGGLVLSQPTSNDLAKLMLVHLCLKGARVDQIIEARRIVHLMVVRKLLSVGRVAFGPREISNTAEPSQGFSRWLAAQTANRAFEFLMEFVTALYDECAADSSNVQAVDERPLLDAIRRGDDQCASAALDEFLQGTERLQAGEKVVFRRMIARHALGTSTTHAARLTQWLLKEIAQRGDSGPMDLGTEAEIGERHNLNRDTVRRAIRMLEDVGVVVPKRGRHGGLASREPDLAAVVELMPPLLYQRRISSDAVVEVLRLLKLEAARLAASRICRGLASGKVAALAEQLLRTPPTRPHELIMMENRLIELTENDVLAACDRGLFFCGPVMSPEFTDPVAPHASLAIANTRVIIEAIRAGDVARAEAAFMKKMIDLNDRQRTQAA